MKDELRLCANCRHEHKWGILRYSVDSVPLYGPRRCSSCICDRFVEVVEGMENLPALSNREIVELWEATSFLNAQVPMATRIAVRQIMDQAKGAHGANALAKILPDFMSLMISQITDIRGALIRDDNKFSHLVAHTDEIVESMRGVAQLNERLNNINMNLERIHGRLDKLDESNREISAVESVEQQSGWWEEFNNMYWGGAKQANGSTPDLAEYRRMFLHTDAALRDEPIAVEVEDEN